MTKKTAPVGAIGRDEEVAVTAFLDAVRNGPAAPFLDGDIGVPEQAR